MEDNMAQHNFSLLREQQIKKKKKKYELML